MPLGNCRRNFDRRVMAVIEWVGGMPSGVTSRGSLYHPSSASQRKGASRALAVIQSVSGTGPIEGMRGNSAYPNGLNGPVWENAMRTPSRSRSQPIASS
jgi:hypothetical protein